MPIEFRTALVVSVCTLMVACHRQAQPEGSERRASQGELATEHGQPRSAAATDTREAATDGLNESAQLEAVRTRREQGVLAEEIRLGDQIGHWTTEAIHEAIKKRLSELGKIIESKNWQRLESGLVFEQFLGSDLTPPQRQIERVFRDARLTVLRPTKNFRFVANRRGVAGLSSALQQFSRVFKSSTPFSIHFKVYRITLQDNVVVSDVHVDTDGAGRSGIVQQEMAWRCQWRRDARNDWQLASILLLRFEEVHLRGSPETRLFSDCTESVLSGNESFHSHLRHGIDHWRLRLEERFQVDSVSLTGLAVADVNGDGLDDVYFCDAGGLPNRLFVQQPDGTAVDMSAESGVNWLDRSYGALFADLDNDGDQDLIVSAGNSLLLMQNNGSGRFSLRERLAPHPTAYSLTAVDYNNDRLLDIYVCSYGSSFEAFGESKTPLPWHDANNGTPNTLFRNDGAWRFTDATEAAGLDANNRRYSYAACWDDFDNDGDQDLYVANDFGRNNLYINQGTNAGTFRDAARQRGVEDISPGMSADWGDYNNDGWMDLYVSNMFSAAGNRITFQDRFLTGATDELIGNYRRFARGNTLFQSNRQGGFEDVSVAAGVTMGRWAWCSLFVDVNNDGWQDLIVANGHVSGVQPDDL